MKSYGQIALQLKIYIDEYKTYFVLETLLLTYILLVTPPRLGLQTLSLLRLVFDPCRHHLAGDHSAQECQKDPVAGPRTSIALGGCPLMNITNTSGP